MQSNRGAEKFVHEGFIYIFDKASKRDEKKFWRCEQKDRCKARLHTLDGLVVNTLNDHSHDSDPAKQVIRAAVSTIKRRAEESLEETSRVINEGLKDIPQCVLGVMPTQESLKKTVRRLRKQNAQAPAAPQSLEALIIPERYSLYVSSPDVTERFLLHDTGPGNDRILMFGRQSNITLLGGSPTWFIDGTFSIAPPLFDQVFVVLAEHLGGVHPLFYFLLPNKRQQTYMKVFSIIKNLDRVINPSVIHCDFEKAVINAIRRNFPSAAVGGCLFHLVQNMRKHVGQLGLTARYNNEPEFALNAKMVTALSFVPPSDIEMAVERLGEHLPEALQPLLSWFEDTYVGKPGRRGAARQRPLFSDDVWSVHQRTLDGGHRTNNHAEAAHRRLQSELGMQHPTLWRFIDSLRKIQKGRDAFYEALIAGRRAPEKLKKFRMADERISHLLEDYSNRSTLDFLKGIAYNYQMSN